MSWSQWKAKQHQPCLYCGNTRAPLEFHHREPSRKSFSLGSHPERQWNVDEVAREMAKCDLCCHHCHVRMHRAANLAYQLDDGEAELRHLLGKGFRPIQVDAALTLLRDMKRNPALANRLLRNPEYDTP